MSAEQSRISYELARLRRHWEWGRADGFGRLVEEDDLNPLRKASLAYGKWRWRRAHPRPDGSAVPVYLLGVQRSGTNMLVRGLEASPEFEVRNENDRETFARFRLRMDRVVPVVSASRHQYVLFKPLCDSHRATVLLDELDTAQPGRALWAYRDVDGRARSAVAKFGDTNLRVLREIAAGGGQDRWEAQGLSDESRALIGSFDWDARSPHEAAAVFWLVRNALYFEQGLDRRDDVALSSYEALVDDPEGAMRALCGFLQFPYSPHLIAHIDRRARAPRAPLELDPTIRKLCNEMRERLDASLPTTWGGRSPA
jgi:hypothetical protein